MRGRRRTAHPCRRAPRRASSAWGPTAPSPARQEAAPRSRRAARRAAAPPLAGPGIGGHNGRRPRAVTIATPQHTLRQLRPTPERTTSSRAAFERPVPQASCFGMQSQSPRPAEVFSLLAEDEQRQSSLAPVALAFAKTEPPPVGCLGPHSVLKPPSIDDISKTSPVSEPRWKALVCRQLAPQPATRVLLAMQKVEGSNPISRFAKEPANRQVFCPFSSPELLSPRGLFEDRPRAQPTHDLKLGGFAGKFPFRRTVVTLQPPQKPTGSDRA